MKKNETIITPQLYEKLLQCSALYGVETFEDYIDRYLISNQIYSCKSDTEPVHIFIKDISHLTIHKHRITIHTNHGTYQKHGSVNNELSVLLPHGFNPCSLSCLVSISKIKKIHQKEIFLIDGTKLPLSQRYAKKFLLAFASFLGK